MPQTGCYPLRNRGDDRSAWLIPIWRCAEPISGNCWPLMCLPRSGSWLGCWPEPCAQGTGSGDASSWRPSSTESRTTTCGGEAVYRAVMHALCQMTASSSQSAGHRPGGRANHRLFLDDRVYVMEIKLNGSLQAARPGAPGLCRTVPIGSDKPRFEQRIVASHGRIPSQTNSWLVPIADA